MKNIKSKPYQPSTWDFDINESGKKVYKDHLLNIVQENLFTMYNLIDDVRIYSNIDLLNAQTNINAKTVADPTTETIGLIASKLLESIGVFWAAGTPAGIIATIVGKLASAAVTLACKNADKDDSNAIQQAVNDIRECMNAIYNELENRITHWIANMKDEWNVVYHCDGSGISDMKGDVKLSDMAECDWYFPQKGMSDDYVSARNFLQKKSLYLIAKELLPTRWKIKECYRAFPSSQFGDLLCGWQVEWYKVRGKGTWDSWTNNSQFPSIPGNLNGDIEGPFDDIEKGSNYNNDPRGGVYYFQWWRDWDEDRWHTQPNYPWSRRNEVESVCSKSRWMNWGGRYCTENNPEAKSGDNNSPVIKNGDIIKGTPFLDFVEDILNGKYFSSRFPNEPSYFLFYETKRPNENVTITNDKREWTLIGNDSCKDWIYDSNNIFTWGRAYRGIKLRHYYLVDQNENYAPKVLCDWLFTDNGHGKITNSNSIAGKIEVFKDWGLGKIN